MSEPKQDDLPGVIRDESNYRELSKPFPSYDEANTAIQAFFDDVYKLRNKHKIKDVHVVIMGCAVTEDGAEGDWILDTHFGSSLLEEPMTAWAMGRASAKRQQAIGRQIKGGIKNRMARK